jgi:hypothetical protein
MELPPKLSANLRRFFALKTISVLNWVKKFPINKKDWSLKIFNCISVSNNGKYVKIFGQNSNHVNCIISAAGIW